MNWKGNTVYTRAYYKENKQTKKQYVVKQNVYVKYLSVFTNMLSHTFLGPK